MKRVLCALLLFASTPLAAELSNSSETGFTVTHSVETGADAFFAYRTMTAHIDQWWSEAHSWSGNAANLYMKIERNGCFCERLPRGGHVEHLRLIFIAPGEELRFDGALGPLQTMPVFGRMIWKIEEIETGSRVTFTYHVNGRAGAGLVDIAPAVDAVIGEQLGNLAKRLDWE